MQTGSTVQQLRSRPLHGYSLTALTTTNTMPFPDLTFPHQLHGASRKCLVF